MVKISERTSSLGTENAFVVLAEVNKLLSEGKKITNFCIGQPDFDTPGNIKDAAIRAIRNGKTGYTASAGIPEAREAVAKWFSKTRGIDVKPESIVLGHGGKPFIHYVISAVTDYGKGDEVLYPNPGYPIYESQVTAQGAKPVPLPLLEKKDFCFDLDYLKSKVNENSKLLILNSPQNPTGGVLTREELEEVAGIVRKYDDLWVYSDEVYSKLVYDGKFESIAALKGMQERTIMVDCLSKTYAMTGWRLGFMSNEKLAPHVATWMTNTDSCINHPTQYACVEALNGPQDSVEKMVKIFRERRDLIVKLLNDIEGVKCHTPGGAFYVYPNVTEACGLIGVKNSEEFRKKLLYEAGVACVCDIHFGPRVEGEGQHIRFSYASSTENIKEGMKRIKEFVEKSKK